MSSNALSEIKEVKAKYGQAAEDIIASGLNLQCVGSKYKCPNAIAHENNDRTPSMSWDPKALQFHCFGCGMNIDLYGYYREHLNYTHQEVIRELLGAADHKSTTMEKSRNIFKEGLKKILPVTPECIEYIKKRGITEATIKHFEIMSYEGQIAFPYFRFETITGYKLRKPMKDPGKPKMKSLTGSKPYLFNSKNVSKGDELIICEGEFDCMVIHQCGYPNVVSVGAGANSMGALIEQAKDFLNSFTSLIIVSDNDEPGGNMDKYFLETFKDKVKLIDKKLYTQNDINEEYVRKGIESIKAIIESARWKIEGRRDLDRTPYKGLEKLQGRYIPTGIDTIDNGLNDLAPGCVTLITGRTNGGKTTFTKQIIANAINTGSSVYLMSGEGNQEILINEIYQCVIGRNPDYYKKVKINKKYHKEPKPEVLKALQKWHYKKLTLFNKGESKLKTMPELFSMMEYEIKINRHDLIVIDNLMSILSSNAVEKNEHQAEFMQRCTDIAKIYRCHIILVLHPNKSYQKGSSMSIEQISGTSDLGNKADNVISVNREYDEEKKGQGINGKIEVIKNRYYPDLPSCEVHFHKETGQLAEIKISDYVLYNFDWEKYLPEHKQESFEGFKPTKGDGEKWPWDN